MLSARGCWCCHEQNLVRNRKGKRVLSATGCQCCKGENQVKIRGGRRALSVTDCEYYKQRTRQEVVEEEEHSWRLAVDAAMARTR